MPVPFNNFTNKSQEALQDAQKIVLESGNMQFEPVHLLLALLEQEEGVVEAVLRKMGADLAGLTKSCEADIKKLPVARNGD